MAIPSSSPYYASTVDNGFLGTLVDRPIPKSVDDKSYTIEQKYNLRPDLLAYDLYGDPALWWVFVARNPSVLRNPLLDFKAGLSIFVVPRSVIISSLNT
jgi:hypothetical protein